ncbi:MAG: tRNA (adenosine(37)-N6)-threonylcarbamoyltransferase complex dimerization subunit type 1 TsaB [Patescibacteria group bacterium]
MILLTIRTDKPEAEVGLFDGRTKLEYETWHAHRELSVTLHKKIEDILARNGRTIEDIQGIIGFAGPGSFTGLRIGLTVVNTLAYGLYVPVVAAKGDDWIQKGAGRLLAGEQDAIALPEYGAPVHITQPRK